MDLRVGLATGGGGRQPGRLTPPAGTRPRSLGPRVRVSGNIVHLLKPDITIRISPVAVNERDFTGQRRSCLHVRMGSTSSHVLHVQPLRERLFGDTKVNKLTQYLAALQVGVSFIDVVELDMTGNQVI